MRRPRRLAVPVVVVVMAFLALAPAANADNVGNSTYQHTSLWNYYSGDTCVAIAETTAHTNYPTDTWNAQVSAASNAGGSYSWSVTIKGFLGLSYTPGTNCQSAFVVNTNDLVTHGDLYFWNGSQWTLCQTNAGSVYGSYWASNSGPTWGLGLSGTAQCGAGWYYSDGTGMALENGTWQGYEPYLTNAGPSGPIYMDY